ncbi:MAG: exonuclease SbcCD subunit D [Fusobacteriaceae bacterium]|nr:exonuclease SbcCD subunit D [Fusobacteriaceae bacterium]MBP6322337.1 exonuclease SbcCD subunit D [Fusobacteriaceae bacterium]MBP9510151.1 exonuclease SbcCD subunit D [Fusobacteriaceae bacterium]
MKILHCSDIHLGKKPFGTEIFTKKRYDDYFNAFNELVEKSILEKVDIFMIAGDLFDKKDLSPDILKKTEIILKKLVNSNIKTLIIEGNHDNSNPNDTIDSWLHYLEKSDLARRLSYKKIHDKYFFDSVKIEDINFYGLGYPGYNVDNVALNLTDFLDANEKNIVLIHTAIGGGENSTLPGLIKTETLKKLSEKTIYIGGGHFHSKSAYPAEKPFFFIPGSTEYWNILNEKNNEKGAFIFDTNTYEHSYINITPRKRVIATFDIKEYLKKDYLENIDLETLKLHFQNFIESLSLTEEELVIINFIIENNQYINTKEFEEILEKNGALKGYIIPKFSGEREFETTPLDYEDCALTHIEKGVINKWEGGYFQKIDTVKYLLTLKNLQLNKDDPNTFNEVFDKMLMEVIGDEN